PRPRQRRLARCRPAPALDRTRLQTVSGTKVNVSADFSESGINGPGWTAREPRQRPNSVERRPPSRGYRMRALLRIVKQKLPERPLRRQASVYTLLPMESRAETRYQTESVVRACRILSAFRTEDETLRLQDLADRAELPPSTTLRLVRTLE